MSDLPAALLHPRAALPSDSGLPELPSLFEVDWVRHMRRAQVCGSGAEPRRIRLRQFSYNPGRRAVASYAAEWRADEFMPSEQFAVELERGKRARAFLREHDPNLPGLSAASSPEESSKLISKYALSLPARRVIVDTVRYRPGSRAVLRHKVGRVRFYVRVMRPSRVDRLLDAAVIVAQSGFALPRLAGVWREGGVVWLSEMRGKNLRELIRQGARPDPAPLLDGLARLWSAPHPSDESRAFNLASAYRRANRIFRQILRDDEAALMTLKQATRALDPFVSAWRPSATAHNDLYDDQMLLLADGRLAQVDSEEAGPGDPMLDIGNFLAHLRWTARFGSVANASASGTYHRLLRAAALERFGWQERDLDLREAVCVFRVCTNPIRRLSPDWLHATKSGLALVNQVME